MTRWHVRPSMTVERRCSLRALRCAQRIQRPRSSSSVFASAATTRPAAASTGSYRGKGEALWKSLHVLGGDIVAWIDTDVTSAHPKFVYGIVGPLLMRPDLQFVKAFYQRPLRIGDELQATGGGIV